MGTDSMMNASYMVAAQNLRPQHRIPLRTQLIAGVDGRRDAVPCWWQRWRKRAEQNSHMRLEVVPRNTPAHAIAPVLSGGGRAQDLLMAGRAQDPEGPWHHQDRGRCAHCCCAPPTFLFLGGSLSSNGCENSDRIFIILRHTTYSSYCLLHCTPQNVTATREVNLSCLISWGSIAGWGGFRVGSGSGKPQQSVRCAHGAR